MGVFRYQEVAWMARETARYASVHGGLYQQETGNTSPTTAQLKTLALAPTASLDSSAVSVFSVTLNTVTPGTTTPLDVDWDSSNKAPYTLVSTNGKVQTNWVTVQV